MFGKNLRYLREKAGYKQSFLAERLGRSPSSISLWENAGIMPNTDIIMDICDIFNVTPKEILMVDIKKADNRREQARRTRNIPMLGRISAGIGILAEENLEGYFEIDESVKADFCLKVKGDSMIDAGINYGDIVFFRKQPRVENGTIAAIQIQEENDFEPRITLKKITVQDNSVILEPANKKYDSKIFRAESIRVLGKLVAVMHYYD